MFIAHFDSHCVHFTMCLCTQTSGEERVHNENVSHWLTTHCWKSVSLSMVRPASRWCRFRTHNDCVFRFFCTPKRNYSITIHKRLYFTTIHSASNIIIKARQIEKKQPTFALTAYNELSQKLISTAEQQLKWWHANANTHINRARIDIDFQQNPPALYSLINANLFSTIVKFCPSKSSHSHLDIWFYRQSIDFFHQFMVFLIQFVDILRQFVNILYQFGDEIAWNSS